MAKGHGAKSLKHCGVGPWVAARCFGAKAAGGGDGGGGRGGGGGGGRWQLQRLRRFHGSVVSWSFVGHL